MYFVVFRNRKRPGIDAEAYSADAARMEKLARSQPGFLSFKTYEADDGECVAISEWASEAAVHAWGSHPDHARIQMRGKDEYYQEYTLFSCVDPRVQKFKRNRI